MTDTPTDRESFFLIEKRGLYYRPDAAGYTGVKAEAGRYSFEEAAEHVGPNGPDGPQDGLSMWREADAPEFSSRCPWEVKLRAERDAAIARAEAAEAEVERLLKRADDLGYECESCGHVCGNPESDIKIIRRAGALSCCPERKLRPLSAALKDGKPND